MNNHVIEKIIKNKLHCYFISPHLDDAVFSAGTLISLLVEKKVPVTVINVMTSSGSGFSTLSAKMFLQQSGGLSKSMLYTKRINEDKNALKILKVNEIIQLDIVDALWRQSDKGNVIYPTYRFHIIAGKISTKDGTTVNKITEQLRYYINDSASYIFCPIGIGNHVDHLIVKESVEQVFEQEKIIYWKDFPYSINTSNNKKHKFFSKYIQQKYISSTKHLTNKINAAKKYSSQYKIVIGEDSLLKNNDECYYQNKDTFTRNVSILSHIQAMVISPRDYLYNFISKENKAEYSHKLSSKQLNDSKKVINIVKNTIPWSEPQLIGATGLSLEGSGDIDIIVPIVDTVKKLTTQRLSEVFGKPYKVRPSITQWKFKYDKRLVDLDVILFNSRRYREQMYIFYGLSIFANWRYQYLKLKKIIRKISSQNGATIKIIFYKSLVKYAKKFLPEYPQAIGEYAFHRALDIGQSWSKYKFAEYVNSNGQVGILKIIKNKANLQAKKLIHNECYLYSYLSTQPIKRKLKLPKLISVGSYNDRAYILLQKIDGKSIQGLSDTNKMSIYIELLNIMYDIPISKNIKIHNRSKWFYLGILPIISFLALTKDIQNLAYIRMVFSYIKNNYKTFVMETPKILVHRDINDNGIIVKNTDPYLLDYELSSISDAPLDVVVLILKNSKNKEIITGLLNWCHNKYANKEITTQIKALAGIFAIYDLSIADGHHDFSRYYLNYIMNSNQYI